MQTGLFFNHFLTASLDKVHYYILHAAIKRGDLDVVKFTLEKNPELLNQTDKFNQTALLWAARYGHKDVVEYLISLGAHLNLTTNNTGSDLEDGRTALHWAAENKNWPVVSLLVRSGATIDQFTLQNANFRTYLYHYRDLDVARALANDRDLLTILDNLSILHKVARYGYLDIVKIILEKNPDLLNQTDKFNQTPLIWAASRGHKDVVEYLISLGADLSFTTDITDNSIDNGRTALDWAKAAGYSEIVTILQEATRAAAQKKWLENSQTCPGRPNFLNAKRLPIVDVKEDFSWVNAF